MPLTEVDYDPFAGSGKLTETTEDPWGKLSSGYQYSPEEAQHVGKTAGLSDDEIKRNYALNIAQRGEEPTTLLGMKQLPSWVPYFGGKPATTAATAAPDPALGTAGAFAQGLPVVGSAVPDSRSIDWLKKNHPNIATAANIAGSVAGSIPAFAAAPGAIGATAVGAGLNSIDNAVRQYNETGKIDPSKVATSGILGGAGGLFGSKVLPRIVTPFPHSAKPPQLPPRLNEFASRAAGAGLGWVAGHEFGNLPGEGLAVLGLLLGENQPGINGWLANKAMTQVPSSVQGVVSALTRKQAPEYQP